MLSSNFFPIVPCCTYFSSFSPWSQSTRTIFDASVVYTLYFLKKWNASAQWITYIAESIDTGTAVLSCIIKMIISLLFAPRNEKFQMLSGTSFDNNVTDLLLSSIGRCLPALLTQRYNLIRRSLSRKVPLVERQIFNNKHDVCEVTVRLVCFRNFPKIVAAYRVYLYSSAVMFVIFFRSRYSFINYKTNKMNMLVSLRVWDTPVPMITNKWHATLLF